MSNEQFTVEEMIKKIEDMIKDGWNIYYYDKLVESPPNGEVNLAEIFEKNPEELPSLLRKDKTGLIIMKKEGETKKFTKIAFDTFEERRD